MAGLAFRAQVAQPKTGANGLVGEKGVVKQVIEPEGKVLVHGELWRARSNQPIQEGVKIRVVQVQGLTLEVTPDENK